MTTVAQRHELAAVMETLVAHKDHVHYAEIRPMATKNITTVVALRNALLTPKGITMDCSESVTLLCHVAGMKDPNGLNYSGAGNTQVMLGHLPNYLNPAGAGIGALCFFGVPGELGTQHITMVHTPGTDPLLFTHGGEEDPNFRRLSWMRSGFQGHPIFLNISKL
jgi:hypothetical protein